MKSLFSVTALTLIYMIFSLSSCAVQGAMALSPAPAPAVVAKAPPAKAPEAKAKPIKARGDVGLLDLDKNYMILVTKEGKLITVDFNEKSKVTRINPTGSKMEDIGLGSSASVEYQTNGDKKIITKIEYKAAKGGD
ncbi:MAG: hypothetical protein HYV05_14045 [Deltaproteobacteria bacterium]|nr:hypothetical protein [Deltaproteobacteria bacterium]